MLFFSGSVGMFRTSSAGETILAESLLFLHVFSVKALIIISQDYLFKSICIASSFDRYIASLKQKANITIVQYKISNLPKLKVLFYYATIYVYRYYWVLFMLAYGKLCLGNSPMVRLQMDKEHWWRHVWEKYYNCA